MAFVIDASVTAAWCFPDEDSRLADLAFERLAREAAIVPALWWFEVRNILVVGERRGRIDAASSRTFLGDLERLPIRIDREPDVEALMALARRHRLTAYDAAYLELALRSSAPIASLDQEIVAAASKEGLESLHR